MIGIDPKTGKTVTGFEALKRRFIRILTTEISSRVKRRKVGNPALRCLGKLQTPQTTLIIQNLTLSAFTEHQNGLSEFKATQCIAQPTATGYSIKVIGKWKGNQLKLEGEL
ncbi:hypothetical protein [Aliivibrio sp. EL58]|uniref:hypothetical protein n=1 Tax=Aliivibrio sp. EL58 TaxID=2107582 RepID=UPI00076AAF3B|nr:hypothetical protein [Aliivibrio sp. EL58]